MRFFLLFICILFAACNDSHDTDTFTVTTSDHFAELKGWVIYHDSASMEPLEVHDLKSENNIEFGNVDRANVTVITVSRETNREYTFIRTYLNAKTGRWKLKGANHYYRGKANVSMTVPYATDYRLINLPGFGYGQTSSGTFNVFDTDDETMTILCIGKKTGLDSVYCDWVLKSAYDSSDANTFSFSLTRPMNLHSVTSSIPLSYVYITGYRGTYYNSYIEGPIVTGAAKTNFIASYAPSFDVRLYGVRGNYSDSQGSISVVQYGATPVSFLSVGNAMADALYDSTSLRFHNISTSGTCDVLRGLLTYTTTNRRVVWMLFSSTDATEITFPSIPGNIMNEAGVDLALLRKTGSIAVDDFDTMTGYDDYIDYLYHSDRPLITLHNNLYSYSKTVTQSAAKSDNTYEKRNEPVPDERINW